MLFTEWARHTELVHILEPFKEQTNLMQQDSLALSNVIPCLFELTLHLQHPTQPKTLSHSLLVSLRQYFLTCLDPSDATFSPLAALACFLDRTVCMMHMVALKQMAKTHLLAMV